MGVGCLVVAGNVIAGFGATSLPFQRRLAGDVPTRHRTMAEVGLDRQVVTYAPGLSAWLVEPKETPPRATVVLVHGHTLSEDAIGDSPNPLIDLGRVLHDAGYAVLLPTLGYVNGAHRFSAGVLEARDVERAASWSRRTYDAPVVTWGFSAGGHAVLTALAEGADVDAVIADSAYANGNQVVVQQAARMVHLPDATFMGAAHVMRLLTGHRPTDLSGVRLSGHAPVLLIHGDADTAISPANLPVLERAFAAQTWLVPGAEHVRAYEADPDVYAARTLRFLDSALGPLSGTEGADSAP